VKEEILLAIVRVVSALRDTVARAGQSSLARRLSHNRARVFIVSQADETGVPEMRVWCPLGKLDLDDNLGPYPFAVLHLFLCQGPLRALFLRQIRKGTSGDFQTLELGC
jgi:hypothetical protein